MATTQLLAITGNNSKGTRTCHHNMLQTAQHHCLTMHVQATRCGQDAN